MRRIFHIDLDAFFVAVEQVWEPALRGKPVVVGGRGWRGVVASASYEARKYGVHSGMPLTQARWLCPQAVFVEGRFSRYQEASERFFAILSRFTPFIEPAGIDEAYLDMTGFDSLYGSPEWAAALLKREIHHQIGITASVGIASSKVVAKIASDLAKPDGLVEVRAGEEAGFLHPLPVGLLPGVGPRSEAVLKRFGVSTIGQLAQLSPSLLRHLFGAWGRLLHRSASGIDPSPVEPPPAAKSISRSTTLMEDTLDRPFLEGVLSYLNERVGAELRRMGRGAGVVVVRLRYADFETVQHQRRLPHPTRCHQLLFQTGRELLHQLLHRRHAPVRLVGIGVSHLEEGEQLPLWASPVQRLNSLNAAVDRLRSRYGFTALQTGWTFPLKDSFPTEEGDYVLHTPALSR